MPKIGTAASGSLVSGIDLKDSKYYINRELSMLAFQERVLEEAEDENNPLLDRVKFLAIVGSNLDEFFMVRVAGLLKQIESSAYGVPIAKTADGLSPSEQLAAVRKISLKLMNRARECWNTQLHPALHKAGIHVLEYEELTKAQRAQLKDYFDKVIFPVVTPLAFDPGHPFPHISNLSLNLAVIVRDPNGKEHFARIKVPTSILPRMVPLKRSSGGTRKDGTAPEHHYFTWLDQVISANLSAFFPGMKVIDAHPFRVTRDADVEIQELEAADLLETMEQSVRQRRFGSVVRLTINDKMPENIRMLLMENLELDRNDIYPIEGNTGLSDLMAIYQIDRKDLKEKPFIPIIPRPFAVSASLQEGEDGETINIFNLIREGKHLLHHPYDSFLPVIDFLRSAARDPDVLAIKQTLYRVGRRPPVVEALLEAVKNGKQVAVLVELKARFDEESNIGWARMLEKEGVHVIYGLLGLKTHSKIALVVRKEGDGIRRYVHMATGNYNAVTAQLYEDMGMFTCDEEIGADATDLFNYLTGYSRKEEYRKLWVAPVNLRNRFQLLIDREIEHQQKTGNGKLIFKINHLIDPGMIQHLYRASQAGVQIQLIIRGVCGVRPGIKGVSENISVFSIVGRFLEHSRIYYFHNNGKPDMYLGSADLMPRNIDRRVEVLFPVEDPGLIRHIHEDILEIYIKDNVKSRVMLPDGTYIRKKLASGEVPLNSQEWFLKQRQNYGENT